MNRESFLLDTTKSTKKTKNRATKMLGHMHNNDENNDDNDFDKFCLEENVVNCVYNLFKKLKYNKEMLIVADPQSGKSSCINRILHIFLNHRDKLNQYLGFEVENIYVVINSTLTELKHDIEEKTKYFSNCVKCYTITEIGRMKKSAENKNTKNGKNNLKILDQMCENSIIINDESHADSNVGQTLDEIRKLIGHDRKNPENVNNKLITISATPYAQIASGCQYINLKHGKNYYGFEKMIKLNMMNQANDLTKLENLKHVYENIKKTHGENPKKYFFVRLPNNKEKEEKIQKNFYTLFGPDLRIWNYNFKNKTVEKTNTDVLKFIKKIPIRFTVIFVKDMLRMGVSVNTKNVCCMYDTETNIFTETTVQSFAGRCCGYNKINHKTLLYCDIQNIKKHIEWKNNDYKKQFIPKGANNVYTKSKNVKNKSTYNENN